MAKKSAKVFECSACGHQDAKWSGRCPGCGEWNSMVETAPVSLPSGRGGTGPAGRQGAGGSSGRNGRIGVRLLADIPLRADIRLSSGIGELDRVLGGGVLRGASVLLGGEPGIGKSTLMLQAAAAYSRLTDVLYISGEEAPEQIKMRAERLLIGTAAIRIFPGSQAEECAEEILHSKPGIVIVDSIQTLLSSDSMSAPGSPNQIKFSVQLITEAARAVGASSFLVAHVTKEGAIAGPKLVEHLVDAVLFFDHSEQELRFLRAHKNRFGSTDEIGLFSMESEGLREVADTSSLFLSPELKDQPPGTAIVPVYEGSRILMVEIQALTVQGKGGFGRVYSDRIDQRRVNRVAAVLEKHGGIRLSDQDIYVNVAGGIKLQDVGTELGLAMAIHSARTGIPLPGLAAYTGELSLSGRIRPVAHLRRRLQHAREMGFSPLFIPKNTGRDDPASGSPDSRSLANIAECIRESMKTSRS